jgi:NADPH:quinone reductase-like Zn-dependent oxidoreductase
MAPYSLTRAGAWSEGLDAMRAVVHDVYGGPEVQRVTEVDDPVPADDEVLVRVHATTVNRTDSGFRQAHPAIVRLFAGLRTPRRRILGSEFAGEVVAAGPHVTRFAVGDQVHGVNSDRFGAHAELVAVRETAPIGPKPANMSFDEAAAVCDGAILALTCLRSTKVGEGQRIVVYGASGSIGTATVQLAKHLGAHVTAVCNTENVEIVGSLGADEVIDYTRDDFTANQEAYDVVVDAVGKHSFLRSRPALVPGGRFVAGDFGPLGSNVTFALATPVTALLGGRRVHFPIPRYTQRDVLFLKDLIEAGEYRAVIDRRYPLEDVVEATRYVETGQKVGNVVLTVVGDAGSG